MKIIWIYICDDWNDGPIPVIVDEDEHGGNVS